MKLSEAMRLGGSLMRITAYTRLSLDKQSGCALGVAQAAVGRANEFGAAEGVWPWLRNDFPELPPCACEDYMGRGQWSGTPHINHVIAHISNEHICGDRTWSIDTLADWVATIEPEESPSVVVEETLEALEAAK